MNGNVNRLSALINANPISEDERRSTFSRMAAMAPSLGTLLVTLVLHCGLSCFAQSNANSSPSLPARPAPLTGYRAATVTYTLILQVGSGPGSFRIIRGDYWTDVAGQPIPFAGSKPRAPGDKRHRFTRVVLGSASFSMPLPPLAAGFVGTALLLLVGYVPVARAVRGKATPAGNRRRSFELTQFDGNVGPR